MINTILFDIDGLINIPGFNRQVMEPLQAQGTKELGFWTIPAYDIKSHRVRERIKDHGLRYEGDLIIHGEIWLAFQSAIRKKDQGYLEILYKHLGLPFDEVAVQRGLEIERVWEKCRYTQKFPPVLAEGNFLLVDSDCTHPDYRGTGEYQRDYSYLHEEVDLARNSGFSLILTPEFPNVWEYEQCKVKPRRVLTELRTRLLKWKGEHIVVDLGVELGIYTSSPERK